MGDERDQEVQRTPLWPPDPEPDTRAARKTPDPTPRESAGWTPPTYPWQASAPAERPQQTGAPAPMPAARDPWQSAGVPWEEQPSQQPAPQQSVSDGPTARMTAAPSVSDAPTMRVSATPPQQPAQPAPIVPPPPAQTPAWPESPLAPEPTFVPAPPLEVADAPTQHVAATPAAPGADSEANPTAPQAETPPAPTITRSNEPVILRAPKRKGPSPTWRLGLTLVVILLLLGAAGGLYAYAASLAAAPQRIMTSYCAALTHRDYHTAYSLLSANAKAQQTEAQFVADAQAHDVIEGPVTGCSTSTTQILTPLSFLGSPRSLIFNAQITRKQAASGQIALTRDALGWHVAALSSPLQGVDLGPLAAEQTLCKAFGQHAYDQAFAMLSTPYQREQGNAATFARAFGDTVTVTGCAPNLKSYRVNAADQRATFDTTLTVSIAATATGSLPGSFALPAHLAFVRESTGWRVDAITPLLTQ